MSDKAHWLSKIQPLGRVRVEVAYQRTFTESDADRLRAGLWPQDMEDRWVVYLGESSLDLWRSWTGHCIYSLPARATGEGVVVGPLFVNDDSQQYRRPEYTEDIQIFESIVDRMLSA